MTYHEIQGLIAATFTPMHKDGRINPEPIREYSRYLISNNLAVHARKIEACGVGIKGPSFFNHQPLMNW